MDQHELVPPAQRRLSTASSNCRFISGNSSACIRADELNILLSRLLKQDQYCHSCWQCQTWKEPYLIS